MAVLSRSWDALCLSEVGSSILSVNVPMIAFDRRTQDSLDRDLHEVFDICCREFIILIFKTSFFESYTLMLGNAVAISETCSFVVGT